MTDKYQDLREALSNLEYSDSTYWLDRYRGESGPETIRELLDEREQLHKAVERYFVAVDSLNLEGSASETLAAIADAEAAEAALRELVAAHRKRGDE